MILILVLEFLVVESIAFQIISLVLSIGSLVTGIVTFLVCPGITFKEKEEYENDKNLKNVYCQQCNFTYPKNKMTYKHCFPCGVCIPDKDHHCGVFGKCIIIKKMLERFDKEDFTIGRNDFWNKVILFKKEICDIYYPII